MSLRLSPALLLTAVLAAPAPSFAEPDAGDADPSYETLVTVESTPLEGISVGRVSREEIERSGASSVAGVLELQPAIHATTGSRGERIFTLRGFEQRDIVVLVDGSPAYIPYDGQVDLGMIPAPLVDHVTLIKGPGSVLYGPGGMGGAVNIVTRRPGQGPLLKALLATGRANAYALQGYHAHRLGRVAYTIHGSIDHRDGLPLSRRFAAQLGENGVLRSNSDRQRYSLGGRVALLLAPRHRLEGGLTFVDGSRGVPPSTLESVAQFWRFTSWRALNLSLAHQGQYLRGSALEVDELVYATLFDNLLDSYDDASFTTQDLPRSFHNWYRDRVYGGRVRLRHRTGRLPWGPTALRLWAGAQHERHSKELEGGTQPARSRTIVTLAPETELFLGERWRALAAFQLDLELPHADALERQLGLGPLVSLRFDPLRQLLLRATAARRTRFPTLKERFSEGSGFRLPNPGLLPESAWHIGLETEWRPLSWLVAGAALFDAEVEQLVEQIHVGSGLTQLQNTGAARLLGAELSVRVQPLRWVDVEVGYGWLHARRDPQPGAGDELEYRPAHKLALSLLLRPWRWCELSTLLRVVGDQPFRNPLTGAWGTLGAYPLLDARVTLRPWSWLDINLSARNLLDANYQTEYGFPDPGLQLWVGLRVGTGYPPPTN